MSIRLKRTLSTNISGSYIRIFATNGRLGIYFLEEYRGSRLGTSEAAIMFQTIFKSGPCIDEDSSVHTNLLGLELVAKHTAKEQKECSSPSCICHVRRWLSPFEGV